MKPLAGKVIIEVIDQESSTTILLPEKKDKSSVGRILMVADNETDFRPGETIVFAKHRVHMMKADDEEFGILNTEDIHAKVTY